MSWQPEVDEIEKRRALARRMGGAERVARQHKDGKYTIRERIEKLLDAGTFREYGSLAGSPEYEDGELMDFLAAPYVMGSGRIDGRPVCVGGEDFTVRGGSASMSLSRQKGGGQRGFVEELALEYRVPLVLLLDGSGANIGTLRDIGFTSPPNTGRWDSSMMLLETVPVVGAVLGSAAGGPAAQAMLTHWTCMVRGQSHIFTAGPPVAKRALGEDLTKEELGGAAIHTTKSGVIDNAVDTEEDAFAAIRRFLSFMPSSVYDVPPMTATSDRRDRREPELVDIIPRARGRAYDMRHVLELVFDTDCPLFEISPAYGRCVYTMLGRLDGVPVAITAHNPRFNGGAIDAAGADKLTHFLELANYFHLPVVNFVDIPGFMIGRKAEADGTLRKGMRAFYMGYKLTVPQVSVLVRRCYGMGGSFRAGKLNLRLAWPSVEWGSIPIEGGVDAAFKRQIAEAPDPELMREQIEADLRRLRSPFGALEHFSVEEMIDPSRTREYLCDWMDLARRSFLHEVGPQPQFGVRP